MEIKTSSGRCAYFLKTGKPLNKDGVVIKHPVARQSWQLTHDQLTLQNKLGEGALLDQSIVDRAIEFIFAGAYGVVYAAVLRVDEQRTLGVAVKQLRKLREHTPKEERNECVFIK